MCVRARESRCKYIYVRVCVYCGGGGGGGCVRACVRVHIYNIHIIMQQCKPYKVKRNYYYKQLFNLPVQFPLYTLSARLDVV